MVNLMGSTGPTTQQNTTRFSIKPDITTKMYSARRKNITTTTAVVGDYVFSLPLYAALSFVVDMSCYTFGTSINTRQVHPPPSLFFLSAHLLNSLRPFRFASLPHVLGHRQHAEQSLARLQTVPALKR